MCNCINSTLVPTARARLYQGQSRRALHNDTQRCAEWAKRSLVDLLLRRYHGVQGGELIQCDYFLSIRHKQDADPKVLRPLLVEKLHSCTEETKLDSVEALSTTFGLL